MHLLLVEVCLEFASAPARHSTADFCVDCSVSLPWVVQLRHAWAGTPCKPSSSPALWRCWARHVFLLLLKVCYASGIQGVDVRLRTWLQTRTGVVQASALTPAKPSSPTPHPANPLLTPPARMQQSSTPRQTRSLPKTWLHDPSLAQRAPLANVGPVQNLTCNQGSHTHVIMLSYTHVIIRPPVCVVDSSSLCCRCCQIARPFLAGVRP